MDGKVISLGKARKARARVARKASADANAARFGRTKAERAREAAKSARDAAHVDGHKRAPDGRDGGSDGP